MLPPCGVVEYNALALPIETPTAKQLRSFDFDIVFTQIRTEDRLFQRLHGLDEGPKLRCMNRNATVNLIRCVQMVMSAFVKKQ